MIKAHNADGRWVFANDALRTTGAYYCPECKEPVSVVLDSIYLINHFRHRADSACAHGAAETLEHELKKLAIFNDLSQAVGHANVEIECRLPDGQRPDICFHVKNQDIAVEVQRSRISDKDLADRTASYSDKGVACLWMPSGIKGHLNDTSISSIELLARSQNMPSGVPRWMARIAGMTDGVAFDHYSDAISMAGKVIGIGLVPKATILYRPDGTPYYNIEWPTSSCVLHVGDTRKDVDDEGHPRLLWIPQAIDGTGLVSKKGRREQRRREISDHEWAYVNCNRSGLEREIKRQIREAEKQREEENRQKEKGRRELLYQAAKTGKELEQRQWEEYQGWIEQKREEQDRWIKQNCKANLVTDEKLVEEDDVLSPLSKDLQILFLDARKRSDDAFYARRKS